MFLFFTNTARPQGNNAVSITIIGSGSYSAKLSDFYKPGSEGMLTVMLRNQDLKEATIPVQLYMSVSNLGETYMLTKSPNITPPIHLSMGETKALTGKDLDCIFNTNYLTFKGTEFKEGTNILKIYARDMRTGKVVSNTASITLKSVVIGAPKLLAPDNGIVIETENPFHLFRWQGDDGGPHKASAYNYFYSLEIWRQNNNDPNVEVQRTPDFYADYLKAEQYQMLFSSYPFEIGQKYCWRVRAYDPAERTTFINEGKSEVRSFTYKHLPVPVTGLTHKIKETTRVATATWNSAEGHTKYYIEYYNPQTKKTITNTTNEPKYTLSAAPEGDYKILFRVKAQCWNDDNRQSSWTPWDTIHYTPRPHVESEYECGHKFPKVEITNYSLKTDFEEGDIVSEANGSSNYEIINCTADADSTLRGQFYLVMDAWGGTKIACDFWDTKINTDNVIITTRYRNIEIPGFVVDPDEIQRYVKSLWLDANSVATSSKIRDTIVIDEKFDYLYIADDGTLYAVVVNPDGSTNETAVHTNKSTSQCLITDGQGDSLVISQKGQVMGIQEYRTTGGNRALLNEIHRKSDSLAQWQINFISAKEQQVYAFDQIGSGNHGIFATEEYYPTSGKYDFRYKSVECGQTDRVIVDFGSYPQADSVIFKDKYGVKLKVVDGNILTFTGVNQADTNFIYAYRGDQKIGKLFLNTYQRKTYKVVLVSVNKAKIVNRNNIEEAAKIVKESLDKVYNQCAVQFEITTDEFTLNDLTSFSHGGSGILTVYNDDQKRLLTAYEKEKKMQDKTYYLFFVNNVTDKKDGSGTSVSGYMPRGYNAGFIYDGGSPHTIAHELGHGIAGLEHVFENSSNSGKTANLMDYASGEELWHFQWDQIQDPSRVWMKWNKDEGEGEMIEGIKKTEWVLVIYSPFVSDKFHQAYTMRFKENIYAMRQWTYKALNQTFKDKHLGWYTQQAANYTGVFENKDHKVARLIHFDGAKKGMTVIVSKYDDNKHIIFDRENTYYFPPYEGNIYVKLGLAFANILEPKFKFIDLQNTQSILTSLFMGSFMANSLSHLTFYTTPQEQLRKLGLEGLFYPVDIFLYDENTQKCDGDSHYGPLDFIGVQVAGTAIAGYNNKNSLWDDFLKLFNLNNAEAGTITIGRMRGYGVCAYKATLQNGGGLDVGVALAVVGAKYNGRKDDNYWDKDYSPHKFAGKAVNFSIGYSFVSLDFFNAYDIDEDGVERNNFNGGELEFTLGLPDISGSLTLFSEHSELINLRYYLK